MSFPAIRRRAPCSGTAHVTHITHVAHVTHVAHFARVGRRAGAALLVCALGACAAPWQRFTPGEDASRVTAALGSPKEIYA
ncbi:MAG: hypothetical protein ACRYGL_11205, partial [Janthinobacterium lividum]